jgi:hypothetical protein
VRILDYLSKPKGVHEQKSLGNTAVDYSPELCEHFVSLHTSHVCSASYDMHKEDELSV